MGINNWILTGLTLPFVHCAIKVITVGTYLIVIQAKVVGAVIK
jgi:hypothetical protein